MKPLELRTNITFVSKGREEIEKLIKLLQAGVALEVAMDSEQGRRQLDEFEAAFIDLQKEFDQALDVQVDTSSAESDLFKFKDSLSEVLDNVYTTDDPFPGLKDAVSDTEKVLKNMIDDLKLQKQVMEHNGQMGTKEYAALEEELKGVQEQLQKVQTEFKGVGEAAQGSTEGAGSFLEKMAKFEAVGNLGEQLAGLGEQGMAVRQSMSDLAAATGATGDELADLRGKAEDAFRAGVGESLGDAIKIMGKAKTVLGDVFNNEDLLTFTKGAAALGQSFDVDVNEVFDKSRTFIKQFGLDAQESLNLLSYGFQNVRGRDDLLDTLDEYSQLAKKAGFSAEEFVGILTTGMEKGTRDTDKLGDSIKESMIRLNAGDTAKALAEINSPITAAIQNTVTLAEQGKVSVKDLMQDSAKQISDAFDAGQISANVRDQLAVALSGTMAEDVGGQLWSEIFSTPIDQDAIKSKAAEAAATVQNTLGPVTLFDKAVKEVELLKDKAAEAVGPIAQGIGGALSGLSQVAPGLSLITDNFGNIKSLVPKLIPLFGTLWTAITGPIGLTIAGIAALGAALYAFFTYTDTGKEAFTTLSGYISAFVSNAGELLSAFAEASAAAINPLNWITDDGKKKQNEAAKRLVNAVNAMINDASNNIAKDKLQTAVTDAAQIKGDLDKNGELQKLITRFKNAKSDAEKNSLAKAIQEQVPGALNGMQEVVDKNGKLQTVYDISIDKAEEFAKSQNDALNVQLGGKFDDFKNGVAALSNEYDKNKAKLIEMQKQIVETAKNGGDVTDLRKDYADLEKTVQDNAAALAKTAKSGKDLGLVKGDAKDLAGALGFTGEKAALINKNILQAKSSTEAARTAARNLAAEFEKAKQVTDSTVTALESQLNGLVYARKQGSINAEDFKAQSTDIRKRLLEQRKAQDGIAQTAANTTAIYKTQAERVKESLDNNLTQIDQRQAVRDIELEIFRLQSGREAGVGDEIIKQQDVISVLEKKRQAVQAALSVSPDVAQQREFKGQIKDINRQIELEQGNLKKLEFQVAFDGKALDQQLAQLRRDFRQKKISLDIELGIANETSLVDLFDEDLQKLQDKKQKLQSQLTKLSTQVGPLSQATIDSNEIIKKQILVQLEELNSQEFDITEEQRKAFNDYYKRRAEDTKTALDRENAVLERSLTKQNELWEQIYSAREEATSTSFDRVQAIIMDALDAQEQAELDSVSTELKVLTLEEEQKLIIQQRYADLRAKAEEDMRKARIIAEQQAVGQRLALQEEESVKRLEMQQKYIENERKLAEATGDTKAVKALTQQLTDIQTELAAKKDIVLTLAGEFQKGMTETFENLFAGNDDAAKDSMRKTLATVAGFVERLITVAVLEIVLKSDMIKSVAALAGFAAPLVVAGATALISSGIHSIVSPLLGSILAFPTGTRIDEPTVMLAGDGARLGGLNREWLFRDDQLKMVMEQTVNDAYARIEATLHSLSSSMSEIRVVGRVSGSELLLLMGRANAEADSRAMSFS